MAPHAAATARAHRRDSSAEQHRAVDAERGAHSDNLDALRGLAVVAVVIHHLTYTGFHVPFVGTYGGLLGVQLFFVISGYLITESASKHTWKVYWLHRVMRIFPAYWIAYLLFGVAKGILVADRIIEQPFPFLLNLVNLQQLHAVALYEFDVLSVSWTLTVEMIWYLLAPAMLWLGIHRPWWMLTGFLAVSVVWAWMASHQQLDVLYQAGLEDLQSSRTREQLFVLINAAFPAQLVYFGLGAAAFHHRRLLHLTNPWWLLCLGVAITAAIPWFFHLTSMAMQITGLGVFALFLWALRAPDLGLSFMAWTGKVSYSVYLVHFPFIVYGFHKIGHHGHIHLVVTGMLIVTSSYLLFRFIEKPCMGLARQWSVALVPPGSKPLGR
jgi:peptidoglycan/LPS O-acetylase OafA/YrhL